MHIGEFNNIFKDHTNYDFINKLNNIKLRNACNGLKLKDVIYYRLSYSCLKSTQQSIVSKLNVNENKYFTREAYIKKEANINVDVYRSLLDKIIKLHNKNNNSNKFKKIAVDGVYNNHKDSLSCLNMGYFNIDNNIPLDITINKKFKNGEVNQLIKYISENKEKFKRTIIIADRLYSNYKLINFLIENDIKFVIRLRNNLKIQKLK